MAIFSRGSFTLGRVRGSPIRVHWTTFLAALVFTGFDPPAWLGFFLLVVAHELGHALFVWRYRYRVTAIEVNGLGGLCHWSGDPTEKEHAAIAWGGVVAQALLFVATTLALRFAGPPPNAIVASVAKVFTTVNVWMMLINLMPIPPLDGARAWRLLPILAAEYGIWKPKLGSRGAGLAARWVHSASWMKQLAEERARLEAKRTPTKNTPPSTPKQDSRVSNVPPMPKALADQIRKIVDEAASKTPTGANRGPAADDENSP